MSRNGPPKSGIGSKTDEGMGMTIVRLFNPTRIRRKKFKVIKEKFIRFFSLLAHSKKFFWPLGPILFIISSISSISSGTYDR